MLYYLITDVEKERSMGNIAVASNLFESTMCVPDLNVNPYMEYPQAPPGVLPNEDRKPLSVTPISNANPMPAPQQQQQQQPTNNNILHDGK